MSTHQIQIFDPVTLKTPQDTQILPSTPHSPPPVLKDCPTNLVASSVTVLLILIRCSATRSNSLSSSNPDNLTRYANPPKDDWCICCALDSPNTESSILNMASLCCQMDVLGEPLLDRMTEHIPRNPRMMSNTLHLWFAWRVMGRKQICKHWKQMLWNHPALSKCCHFGWLHNKPYFEYWDWEGKHLQIIYFRISLGQDKNKWENEASC